MAPPASVHGTPVDRAPLNVFVKDTSTAHKAWTNVFQLPIEYTVEQHRALLHPDNPTLATRFMPEGHPPRRFLVVDHAVQRLYGPQLAAYFDFHKVHTHTVVLPGEEENKTLDAVHKVFEGLCTFALHRREPILAIGGGVVLDIVGFAASLYRRGVPYIRVPTTLLAIVDASVGVKTGIDYLSTTKGPLKNRMGSFYAPCAAFLDKSFIGTQDPRNIRNGLGEIMKLALVRSEELFLLLEQHGPRMVEERFQTTNDPVPDRIIELSIQIMLEELGPNLWEHKLERCVDYGHTFSKLIEMAAVPPLMHGEAVNVDGFCCVLLSHRRGWISTETRDRIYHCMRNLQLKVYDPLCADAEIMWKATEDAVEHRHGQQRIPLITGIGSAVCVNDVTREEIKGLIEELQSNYES